MKKAIFTYGLISGLLCSLLMVATIPFEHKIGFDRAMFVGYTIIVLSFLLVFFGIRSYRDHHSDGHITFTRAFTIGISITLIMCVFYVLTWEILYFNFMPGFMDQYTAHIIEKARASGASPAVLQAKLQQMNQYRKMYDNPLSNAMMTFIEPFPIGLVITLLSAAILRRKPQSLPDQATYPAVS